MKLSITRKVLGLVAIPLVMQIALFGVLIWVQRQRVESQRNFARSLDTVVEAGVVLQLLIDAETGVRGHAATDDIELLQPYVTAVEQLPRRLEKLRELSLDDSDQAERARQIADAAGAALTRLAEIEELVRSRKWTPDTQRIRRDDASRRLREDKQIMDELRQQITVFLEAENAQARRLSQSAERSRQWITGLLMGGTPASILLTFGLLVVLWRQIGKRFSVLTDNTKRLARHEPLLPALRGEDEMADLDRAFRRMAEQMSTAVTQLRQSEAEARDLYDNAPCGYHSIDRGGNINAMNDTELKWLGYRRDEVVGRLKYTDLMTEKSRQEFTDFYPRFQQTGSVDNIEYEFVRKDGTILPVLVTATAVRDEAGEYLWSRSSIFDNTERRRTEAVIQLYAEIVRHVPIGLIIWSFEPGDGSLLLVLANPIASRLLGIDLDSRIGRPIAEVFPAIPQKTVDRFADVVRLNRADDLGDTLYGDDHVPEAWWATLAFPLRNRKMGVAFQNVSERRRAQDEVQRLNLELDERVRQRTAELAEANRDLLLKNQENEMFVYSVSHDLRSPLVNLQGFSKELGKGCESLQSLTADERVPAELRDAARHALNGKMAKSLGFIQTAVMRLSGIIDALLRLSRAGRVEYRCQWVDVQRIVGSVVDSLQATVADKQVTVRVGSLPEVWADPTALEQVFANLIGNALNYLDPKRPGVIEVGHVAPSEGSNAPAGYSTYCVRDNGLGIAPMHHQKIFQVFQRVHGNIARGEGMGLAIVARVIDRHRGRVWVDSSEGNGSTFYVSLPEAAR